MSAIEKLERELAYSAARSDIECCCMRDDYAGNWYRTTELNFADDTDVVKKAIRYLEYRGLLARHPENPSLIRPLSAHSG